MYQYNLFLRDNLLIYISTDNFGMEKKLQNYYLKIIFICTLEEQESYT